MSWLLSPDIFRFRRKIPKLEGKNHGNFSCYIEVGLLQCCACRNIKEMLSRLQLVQNNAARLIKKNKLHQCDSSHEGVTLVTYFSPCIDYKVLCFVLNVFTALRLSKRNFKSMPVKKILTLNGGFLRNTNDKIKIFWRSCLFQL